jgi:predicted signal transduction protein with EAL and GGDEF domain
LLTALRRPIQVNGVQLEIGASIGVACYPENGNTVCAAAPDC